MNLPWNPEDTPLPLMLAPMQGLTNRGLRSFFIEWVRPDVVFTEFVRVRSSARRPLSAVNRLEASSACGNVPLVVQLIGRDREALTAGALISREQGALHINLNLGCPYGRMSSGSAGGALLKDPSSLPGILQGVRQVVTGSLSVKLRSGFDDPRQIFSLLPIFEDCGIDFLILHPRTVTDKYKGLADHAITATVAQKTSLPVIANGDIFTATNGWEVQEKTKAAGLMLGRGAIGDPMLFERLRGRSPATPKLEERCEQIGFYLKEIVKRYRHIFHGDNQVLYKLKEIICYIREPELEKTIRGMKRSRRLEEFLEFLEGIGTDAERS